MTLSASLISYIGCRTFLPADKKISCRKYFSGALFQNVSNIVILTGKPARYRLSDWKEEIVGGIAAADEKEITGKNTGNRLSERPGGQKCDTMTTGIFI